MFIHVIYIILYVSIYLSSIHPFLCQSFSIFNAMRFDELVMKLHDINIFIYL